MVNKHFYLAGDGTKEEPFEIHNEEEFIAFSLQCMRETEYLYYILKNDLDLSRYLWNPIGALESQLTNREWRRGFYGSLDGGMHYIKGVKLDVPKEAGELHCLGLFAMLGVYKSENHIQTEVKNLRVQYDSQSCVLTAEDTYFGGIAGLIYNSNVKRCLVSGNMIFLGDNKGIYAGGIGGILRDSSKWEEKENSIISDSSFHGSILATIVNREVPKVYIGGIVGSIQSKNSEVCHCISRSFLHGGFTGNIAGSVMEGSIKD